MDACRQAVELAPQAGYIRDSRGLAHALTGDYKRAIIDFKFFVEWSTKQDQYPELYRLKREYWITELEAGRNPFTEAALKELRNE
jgi:hypothetical protein